MTGFNNRRSYTLQLSQFCHDKLLLTNLCKQICAVGREHPALGPFSEIIVMKAYFRIASLSDYPSGIRIDGSFSFELCCSWFVIPAGTATLFFGAPECMSPSLGWEMPSVVGLTAPVGRTEKSHAATSGCFLMGQKSGQWAGETEVQAVRLRETICFPFCWGALQWCSVT